MKGFKKVWNVVKRHKVSILHPLLVGKNRIISGVEKAAKKGRRRLSTWRKSKKETWGFNRVYPHEPPEPPRESSSLSGVTTGGEEEDDSDDELSERSMGLTSPDNREDDIAGLPVLVGIDPTQLAIQSSQDNADGSTVTWVPNTHRAVVRPQREPTRQMGSPYVHVVPLERSLPSLSMLELNLPPNKEASTPGRRSPTV
ncbi:hypothetical protein PEBR_16444 [Penicillium brasilianum]|uniref:Uncharacterized protein n=1 Tax=Penicillium brasilianum TaxID=104259 RepID=A0A1S9RRX0_PENBI|nr:hypothetical protein PEBR_16444 [Penicillium brasilianum]